jgi:peptidyl-prolyl cis-trans isomerase D
VNVLAVDPEAIAQPQAVTEAEARQRYEQLRDARFGTPERRSIQQIVFPTPEEAQAAHARIQAGTTFEALAAERNVQPQELELGTFARAEMVDPAVGDAAFALAPGEVSAPVRGRFGTVLLRATAVEPASVRPFEQVEQEMRREIALERARREINDVHDRVEDLRAGARPLAEIAREKNLPLVQVPAVDRTGRDRAGQPVEVPEGQTLIAAAFASDIGVDNEALRTRGSGYVWYDVVNIEPARDRTFEEVRERVAAQWRADEVSRRLQETAQAMAQRLNHGEAIETVAAERGLPVETASDLRRRAAQGALTADAVDRIFSVPVGQAASAEVADGARAVFRVTGATVPPFVTTTMEAGSIDEQLRTLISDDLLGQYIAHLRAQRPVSVNEQVLRRAVGGEV